MHKSVAIRRRKTDCNACPDSGDPAGATPGADPPTFSPEKPPAGWSGATIASIWAYPHFPWPIFWGLRFLEFLGIADALGSC